MKARAKFDHLEKRGTSFQEFQVAWLECLSDLNAAGVHKFQKDLLYDYLHKLGSYLREEVSKDKRFWPIKPAPGITQEFRAVETSASTAATRVTRKRSARGRRRRREAR